MEIICTHCKKKIVLPDEKVPRGKAFALPCPECKKKISVKPQKAKKAPPHPPKEKSAPPKEAPPKAADGGNGGDSGLDLSGGPSESPFDFLEEGARTAIICETNPDSRSKIRAVIEQMNYHIIDSATPRDALKQMRYHAFDLVVINELFGTRDPEMNHVLKFISQMLMPQRRSMFVTLLTDRHRTNDNMMAYNKSVNLIVNTSDMDKLGRILEHFINDNEMFYKTYLESLKSIKGL